MHCRCYKSLNSSSHPNSPFFSSDSQKLLTCPTQGPSSTISLEEPTGSSTTESTQGPSSTISLEEATGSSTTESTQGPSSTISLEEATGNSTTESTQGPSSTISLEEPTGNSTVTIQPLSESETVAKCRIQPAKYDLKIVRQPNESEKLELLKCDWTFPRSYVFPGDCY